MFSLKTMITTLALCAIGTSARITGITAPSIASSGGSINVTVHTEGYIQNLDEFGIIWGLKSQSLDDCPQCIGDLISYTNLYEQNIVSSHVGNATIVVPLPENQTGNLTLVAGVPTLVGASGGNEIRHFNQSITIT